MQQNFQTILFAALLAAAPAAAFTNGTLVPAYICNPVADGLPKSFGQLLQFTREKTPKVAFNTNAGQDVQAPQLQQTGGSLIGNSAYILASLHDSPNNINVTQQSLKVTPQSGSTIVAGQANKITITTSDGSQLKGAMLYGQDSTGTRQGSFTDAANGPFIPFSGCGKNPQGQVSGVIQQTGVSATSSYSNLVYNAPACVPGNKITIGGLSVTGSGFGIWTYSFSVTGSTCSGSTGSSTSNTGSSTGNTGSTGKTGKSGSKSGSASAAAAGASTAAAATAAAAGSSTATAATSSVAAAANNAASVSSASAVASALATAGTTLTKVAAKTKSACPM